MVSEKLRIICTKFSPADAAVLGAASAAPVLPAAAVADAAGLSVAAAAAVASTAVAAATSPAVAWLVVAAVSCTEPGPIKV